MTEIAILMQIIALLQMQIAMLQQNQVVAPIGTAPAIVEVKTTSTDPVCFNREVQGRPGFYRKVCIDGGVASTSPIQLGI